MVGREACPARDLKGRVRVTGERNRVGDVEVAHGEATVLLILHGRWPGSAQLSPDQADAIAEHLRAQAAHARRVNTAT